jgi:hypothetical protein
MTYRDGPDLVIKSDYGSLIRIPFVDSEATSYFKVWNQDDDSYSIMTFEDVIAAIGTISGFLDIATYDPQGKHADAFARANHTGVQAISTVTGLQTALDGKASVASDNAKLPLAGGIMTGAIQDLLFGPSSAPTKLAHFDSSLITAGQNRAIIVPDDDTALSKWELIQAASPSGVTNFSRTGLSAYRTILISGFVTLATAGGFTLRTSSNNGSSYDSGASDYTNTLQNTNGGTVSSSAASGSSILLATTGGLDAGSFVRFDVVMEGFNKAQNLRTKMNSEGINSSSLLMTTSAGARSQATARNAFQIQSAAAFTGWIVIHGIRG